ncbi:MAG: hypothetical protein BYD32DRAFT_456858 [Podila humilis]|nr:MAG: hypothetical protein BYD32DRAFT_456858 [Podila humilis]
MKFTAVVLAALAIVGVAQSAVIPLEDKTTLPCLVRTKSRALLLPLLRLNPDPHPRPHHLLMRSRTVIRKPRTPVHSL